MKRAATAAALVIAAVAISGSSAAAHPKVTRAQAVQRLEKMLGAKAQRVQLVWADEGTRDVALEWTGFAPQAQIRDGGHYRGPAVAWLAADGGPPAGVGSVRPPSGHHILPLRSTRLPVSLVRALARNAGRVSLVPLRVQPAVDRVKAISKLRSWGDRKGRLQGIWLVHFQHGDGRKQLAWLAVAFHVRVPILGCTRGKKCKSTYTSTLASFLNAYSGKGIEALTINGWKQRQLPPEAGAASAPSLSTDLRLTQHFACLDRNRHRVDRRTLRRFRAVTAVYCSEGQRVYPGQGQWEVLVRKVAVSSVSGLQRYYEQPDERNLPKNGRCFDNLIVLAVPSFVDAHGRWVTPVRWPVDRCGHPLGFGVGHGPPAVRWHVVQVRRIKQVISAAAVAANCPMRWGNTVAWAGPPRDSTGGPLFPTAPKTVRVCVFRTPPDRFAVGNFIRGFRLDASRTRRLLRAAAGSGPKRGCAKQRTFAVVIRAPGSVASVELGGCYRVDRPDRLAGTANPSVVRAILGVR
jgi:hypothetical protein